MKRIHRVARAAVITLALAACGADITAPSHGSEQPSLLMESATATESFTSGVTATSSGCLLSGGSTTVSSTSTYIVAYGGLQFACPAPTDTTKTVTSPAPADTSALKVSFE
jgi:hypothetical protein